MGIRYDRDSIKATNGPMIFFSILQDEAFEEEIRGAFHTGLSFYAYRAPGASMMTYGSSEGWEEGLGSPGFVIGMFSPSLPYITIPYKGIKRQDKSDVIYRMPHNSTTPEEFMHEVEEIVKALKSGRGRKVVASKVIVRERAIDLAEKFYELCRKFPEAYVFCFATPPTGCWIGASPELLLEGKEGRLSTMALAGTREKGCMEPWDGKNIEEQKIVTDYIKNVFSGEGLTVSEDPSFTKPTGEIEHICTPMWCDAPDLSTPSLDSLLHKLSPTPALCGSPRDFALKQIEELEKFERGCYGGFCGPFHSAGDFSFNVVLRCASVEAGKYCIYAGGGVTSRSFPLSEWEETEMKAKNVFGN